MDSSIHSSVDLINIIAFDSPYSCLILYRSGTAFFIIIIILFIFNSFIIFWLGYCNSMSHLLRARSKSLELELEGLYHLLNM